MKLQVTRLYSILLFFLTCTHGIGQDMYDPACDQAGFDARLARLESLLCSDGCAAPESTFEFCDTSPSVYSGFELIWIRPQMKESFEATRINPIAGTNTLIPLNFNFETSPRAWLGFRMNDCVGVRATYWGFDHDGNGQRLVSDGVNLPGATAVSVIYPAAIIAPAPGDVLETQTSLNLQTYDFEGTTDIRLCGLDATFGGGLRYANTTQHMLATATRGRVPIGMLHWSRSFEGVGPTVSGQVNRCLGGGFSAFGNARASLIFGEKTLERTVVGDVTPQPAAGPPVLSLRGAGDTVAAGEMGLGMRYGVEFENHAEGFIQGSWQGQLWTDAGAPTLAFLGLQGIGLAVGIDY